MSAQCAKSFRKFPRSPKHGGLLVRLFAQAHPDATAGVVLVESMDRNQDRRLLPIWRAQTPCGRGLLPKPGSKPVEDGVDLRQPRAGCPGQHAGRHAAGGHDRGKPVPYRLATLAPLTRLGTR